jgi:hypothetical protein
MKCITITDTGSDGRALGFDLRDILDCLGPDVVRSTWTLRNVECVGTTAAHELHEASDRREAIEGSRLVTLAGEIAQVIDGEFRARLPATRGIWVLVRAVDSGAYDVVTDREDVLQALRARFAHVAEGPDEPLVE